MKNALIFGAGNIGRGFIGQLFHESGYDLTMVDVDQVLLEALRTQGGYTIRLVDNDRDEDVRIGPVRALHSVQDREAVIQALCEAELGATALGSRVLPYIAPLVAEGMRRRRALGVTVPLNLILCENLKGAAEIFRGMVDTELSMVDTELSMVDNELSMVDKNLPIPDGDVSPSGMNPKPRNPDLIYTRTHLGLVDTVIGRMVPPPTLEMRQADPGLILVEPYKELPVDRAGFAGEIPQVVGMEPCENFPAYTARKLYIHNCGHAVLAYLGYLKGYEYGWQALQDAEIYAQVRQAMNEAKAGIVAHYGVQGGWLEAHIEDLLKRFTNRKLGDTVFRLGRDPLRKLAPSDRLVGAARLAQEAGIQPLAIAGGIAAALRFDPPDDPIAQDLQGMLREKGIASVLAEVCGIGEGEELGRLVAGGW